MATPILLGIVWSGDKDDGGDTTTADVPAAAAPPAEPKAGLKRARPADRAGHGLGLGNRLRNGVELVARVTDAHA